MNVKKISYLKLDIEQSEIGVLRELIESVLDILPVIFLLFFSMYKTKTP